MKLCVFAFSLAFNCAFSQNFHELHYVVGCFYNSTPNVAFKIDGNVAFYADFENNQMVSKLPSYVDFDLSKYPHVLRNAVRANKACVEAQTVAKGILPETEAPEVQDPPESILYPADEILNGVENRLVCFVNRFFPPRVKVTWTKNNLPVSEGVSVSSYVANKDQTFHCFSTLTFTPVHGDVYSCTVEHSALDMPKTRIWEMDLKSDQDLAFDLYCGIGLTLGFMGVAVGTFLFVKGRKGH